MSFIDTLLRRVRGALGTRQAGPDTDPTLWLSTLHALPDPDPILRSIGQAERVYNGIIRDTHVLGDLRSIRGNFRSHSWRLLVGKEGDPASERAHALCEQWLATHQPAGAMPTGLQPDWLEVFWQMTSAILHGYRAHELVWHMVDGQYLPAQVLECPNHRFRFQADGVPLLISRGNLMGAPVEAHNFVISRHMADAVNPYGIALLSSCFWPWQFKTGGWRVFVKYCERHGLPWPVGRYQPGTPDGDIDKLEAALANMLEAGYVIAPDGTSLELLTPDSVGAGGLPQDQLIDRCNREMSKALTSQAMVAELQRVGARAASETAADRQGAVNNADRDIASSGMNQVFRWITLFNFGDGVAPPTLEFFQHEKAGKDRAETYETAARLGARPSRSALLEELGIPEAENEQDVLTVGSSPATPPAPPPGTPPAGQAQPGNQAQFNLADLPGFEFAKAAGMTEDEAIQLATDAADQAIADHMIAPVANMLATYEEQGKTLAEFRADLEGMVGAMDDDALREVLDRSLTYSILRGAATRTA